MNPEEEKLLSECEVQTYRARGKGGQHVATTDSAVRLIHHPSGIVVTCQQERSQYQNKRIALEKLQKKIAASKRKRKRRIPTAVPKAAKRVIRKEKEHRAAIKKQRKGPSSEEE